MRLIDADALKNELLDEGCVEGSYVVMIVKNQPTIDPVQHGTWVFADEYKDIGKVMDVLWKHGIDEMNADTETIYCSCCGAGFNVTDNQDTDRFSYCPCCGAKMDEVSG